MALYKKYFPFILLLLLIFPAIRFLLIPHEYWNMHDDMQLIRQLEMEKCLKDGQIPCRWTPDLGYGYGYPLFNFYPPFPYYVGQILRTTGISFIETVKLTAVLQFLVAGFSMYLLASNLFGPLGGLISALFYTYAPYHAVNVYIRGAMNEAWAAALFPLIFYLSKKYLDTRNLGYLLAFCLALSGLMLSHNPMVLIFSPILGLWILYWFFNNQLLTAFRQILPIFIGAFLLTLGLSAYFTLPVLFESGLVQIDSMFINYYHFSLHFVSLKQLFISSFWGDGPSLWGPNDGMPFSIGYLHWLLPFIFSLIFLLFLVLKKKLNSLLWLVFLLSLLGLFTVFMSHERSTFLWLLFTPIQKIQFPWRFLNISTFIFSLASGGILLFLPRYKPHFKIYLTFILILLLLILNLTHFTPVVHGPITDSQKFSGQAWTNQVTGGIYDYLPKTAPKAAVNPSKEFIDSTIPAVSYSVSGAKKGTDWQFFNLDLQSPAVVILSTLYFPDFKVTVDGQSQAITSDSELGRISFPLAAGNHQIYLKLHNTPIRSISNLISVASWIIFIILLYKLWKQPKFLK